MFQEFPDQTEIFGYPITYTHTWDSVSNRRRLCQIMCLLRYSKSFGLSDRRVLSIVRATLKIRISVCYADVGCHRGLIILRTFFFIKGFI